MTSEQFGELVAVEGFEPALSRVLEKERKDLDEREKAFNRRESYGKASAGLWILLEVACVVMGITLFFGFLVMTSNTDHARAETFQASATAERYRVMLLENHVDPESGKVFGVSK